MFRSEKPKSVVQMCQQFC